MDLETGITVLLAELQELRHDIAALNDEVIRPAQQCCAIF